MRVASGNDGETAWFEYKTSFTSNVIRVEWPSGAPVAVFDAETARGLIRAGYARTVTTEQLEEYNALVEQYNKAHPHEANKPDPASVTQEAKPAMNTPQGMAMPDAPAPVATQSGKADDKAGDDKPADESEPEAAVFPPDGWLPHPQAEGFYFRGEEVLDEQQLRSTMEAEESAAS